MVKDRSFWQQNLQSDMVKRIFLPMLLLLLMVRVFSTPALEIESLFEELIHKSQTITDAQSLSTLAVTEYISLLETGSDSRNLQRYRTALIRGYCEIFLPETGFRLPEIEQLLARELTPILKKNHLIYFIDRGKFNPFLSSLAEEIRESSSTFSSDEQHRMIYIYHLYKGLEAQPEPRKTGSWETVYNNLVLCEPDPGFGPYYPSLVTASRKTGRFREAFLYQVQYLWGFGVPGFASRIDLFWLYLRIPGDKPGYREMKSRGIELIKEKIIAASPLIPYPDYREPVTAAYDGSRKVIPFQGIPTILVFFNHNCPACKEELMVLQELYRETSSQDPEYQIIAINSWYSSLEESEDALAELRSKGITFDLYSDYQWQESAELYGIEKVPHLFAVNPDKSMAFNVKLTNKVNMKEKISWFLSDLLQGKDTTYYRNQHQDSNSHDISQQSEDYSDSTESSSPDDAPVAGTLITVNDEGFRLSTDYFGARSEYPEEIHVFSYLGCPDCVTLLKDLSTEIESGTFQDLPGPENLIIYPLEEGDNRESIFLLYQNRELPKDLPLLLYRDSYLSGKAAIRQYLQGRNSWITSEQSSQGSETSQPGDKSDNLGILAIFLAGLLDGINPCAFTVILLLISYMMMRLGGKGEIIAAGTVYIAAVFITYYLVGFGLFESLKTLSRFRLVSLIIKYLITAVLIVLAGISVVDFYRTKKGGPEKMILKLPKLLQNAIRKNIRGSMKSRNSFRILLGSLVLGFTVSLFELACTGQVYLPVIGYMVRAGEQKGYFLLALYNIGFIIPLTLVFILTVTGFSSRKIGELFEKNIGGVKLGFAALFIVFAVLNILI